jgi:hypothetical protein
VQATNLNGKIEYSGSVTLTHVGVCKIGGPETKVGNIQFVISRSGVVGNLFIEGKPCSFSGNQSEVFSGFMTCERLGTDVPLRLWWK